VLGTIVNEIFPNECRVLEIIPGTQYVYPIFKNGSSSIYINNYRELARDELKDLQTVDVFVRDPYQRFISGVQTFLKSLDKDFDKNTALYFVKTYLYLNRHYCPQFYWLINLRRFSNTKFNLRPLSDISVITKHNLNQSQFDETVSDYFLNDKKIEFYNGIDEILTVNHINQTVSFDDLIFTLRTNYNDLYIELSSRHKEILDIIT
jgi:hypothetical protein